MADLFPIYRTDGSRATTVALPTPSDFVFVSPAQGHEEWFRLCMNVGSLQQILDRMNEELAANKAMICESLQCFGQMKNKIFYEMSDEAQKAWIQSCVGCLLDPWQFTAEGGCRQDELYGIAKPDLPQLFLTGLKIGYYCYPEDLFYRPINPWFESIYGIAESAKHVTPENLAYERPDPRRADRSDGTEDRDDCDPGEVRESVR